MERENNTGDDFFNLGMFVGISLTLLACTMLFGTIATVCDIRTVEQQHIEIVEAGHGYWAVEDHKTVFKWKDCCQNAEKKLEETQD
jgi:hypothetical protein